jgi:hypothetical protein
MSKNDLILRAAQLEQDIECERKLAREYLSELNAETAKRIELERIVEKFNWGNA